MKITLTPKGAPHGWDVKARQHTMTLDIEASLKGGDTALTPHEAVLGALGGCTVITMALYAAKKGWNVTFELTEVTEDKVDDPDDTGETKKQIARIVEEITVKGDLTDEQLGDLVKIGKKCPVYLLMTGKKIIETKVKRAS